MLDPKVVGCRGRLLGMVALIFFSGMVAGGVTMNMVERYWLAPKSRILQEAEKEMAVQHFSRELNLTEEQVRAIDSILDEFIMEQADLLLQFKNSRVAGHDRILEILNEEQRQKFNQVLAELNNQRRD